MKSMRCSFVVGCGHSGTSLLIRILGQHSHIHAIPGESYVFVNHKDSDTIEQRLREFDAQTQETGKQMWVEKTPKHVLHIADLLAYRCDAKILGITRDPRDVACSHKARGTTFERGLTRWIEDNTALLEHKDNKNMSIVKLEDLVKDSEAVVRDVLTFLGMPYENLLDYHRNPQTWYADQLVEQKPDTAEGEDNHVKLRNWQINQPIFSTTRRYDNDMDAADEKLFDAYRPQIQPIAEVLDYEL